jgi:hypothetical protein
MMTASDPVAWGTSYQHGSEAQLASPGWKVLIEPRQFFHVKFCISTA